MAALKAVPSQNFLQKTLDAQLLAGVTASATLNNTTGIQNLPGVMIVDRVDSNSVETPSKRETIGFTATSGSTVTTLSRGLAGSSDQDHAVGAIVEFAADVVWAQSIYDALSNLVTPSTSALDISKVPAASGATLTSLALNFGSGATGSLFYEGGDKKVNRLALGATYSFLMASGSLPMWYYPSGASGSLLTSQGTGLPVYAAPASTSVGTDGWTTVSDTWTYASASTFTIAGVDRTSIYTPGTKLKFTQTSAKYAVVASSSFSTNTTVTIVVNTDYTIANAAITSPFYSYQTSPASFPEWFAYTTTWGGFSADPTATTRYAIQGRVVHLKVDATGAGTSNAITFTLTAPIASANTSTAWNLALVADNGTETTGTMKIGTSTTTINVFKGASGSGAWTNSGNKYVDGTITYEI